MNHRTSLVPYLALPLALLLLSIIPNSASAQAAYPSKPIRWIVPYPAGGG